MKSTVSFVWTLIMLVSMFIKGSAGYGHAIEFCNTCSSPVAKSLCTLPDHTLYHLGINRLLPHGKVGCRIDDAAQCRSCFCDLYVKAYTTGPASEGSYRGWPRTVLRGRGTGCVKAPDFPKRTGTCFYADPRYRLTAREVSLLCTNSGKNNALAQLRHALCNGQCGI